MTISISANASNYLATNSVQMLPHVSAEWNYNLVYAPFATYAGNGSGINTAAMSSLPSSWTKQSNTSVSISALGKTTSNFLNPSAIQLLVTPVNPPSTSTAADYLSYPINYQGSAAFSLPNVPNPVGCYKIVFYAKSIDNNSINLVTQGSSPTSELSGSSSVTLDNLDWTLVELKVGQKPTDLSYSTLNLNFDITNNTLNSLSQWGILISQIKIYEITYFDYAYGNLWNTDYPFSWFRPGESYVTSGNNLISDSTILSLRNLKTTSNGGVIPAGWNTQAPCSSVTYSPRIIFANGQNPIYKNGVLSPFSQYKYFVSDTPANSTTGSVSIGATYPELISINKIIIKLNVSQSIPDNIVVTLNDSTTNISTSIPVPKSYINAAGVITLYWNGTSWGTSKWSWNPLINNGMPNIDNNGNISMSVGGIILNGYQNIDSIVVTQKSASPLSNFLSQNPAGTDVNKELQRFQVIEVSPRLELDLSNFVTDFNVKKEMDNKNTPLPISSMSANSGKITFSNIPLSGTNNAPLSIFSQIANSTSFVSPLTGLLVKNVKFYLNYYLPTQSNEIIPAGVMYADTWDNQDIKQTSVNCFDIIKTMQTIPVVDYVAQSQSPQNIFSNILDFSGFTDYNYDELVSALSDNNQKIITNFFFADSTHKTLYEALQEALLAYQIGCWVDEYGVMHFKNLNSILSSATSNINITDNNILADSYNESIKTKVGKVLMRYRAPQVKRSLTTKSDSERLLSILQEAPDIIWQPDSEDLVTYNLLRESISNISQNYYVVDQSSYSNPFFTTLIGHQSYCVIEDEIISSGDMEFILTGKDAKGNSVPGASQLIYVSNENDLQSAIGLFSNTYNTAEVSYYPTGKFANVKRGLFGTKPNPHYVMTNDLGNTSSIFVKHFNSYSGGNSTSGPYISNNNLIQIPCSASGYTIVTKDADKGYKTYSAKFRFPKNIDKISASLILTSGTEAYYIQVYQSYDKKKGNSYMLWMYKFVGSTSTVLTQQIDITSIVNSDYKNEPYDALYASELSGFINLKFVNGGAGNRVIYINKHRILIDRRSDAKRKDGTFIYPSNWADATTTSNGTLYTSFPSSFYGSTITFFTQGDSSTPVNTTIELAEIYATDKVLDTQESYFFQTKQYLNSLVSGYNIPDKSLFIQSRPQMFGLNIYDVQLALSPSLGAEFFKVSYAFPYYANKDTTLPPHTIYVKEDALGYSEVVSSGFRAKFAIVNNSNYAVYTKIDQSYTQLAVGQLLVSSRTPIVLTPQMTVEKIINKNILNEVIELQSDWVQSKDSAESILKVLATSSDQFSRDITISVFGNPAIQIGDIINLTYSLKNINNTTFFVSSVDQSWQNGGLNTTLTLNQINYSGITRNSKLASYPSNKNSLQYIPAVYSVSPNSGYDTGGTNVFIQGVNFGTAPSVVFGNIEAKVTGIHPTYLQATAPSSNIDGAVDISIVSNGAVGVGKASNLQGFTYLTAPSIVKVVQTITPSLGTQDTVSLCYPITVNWTLDTDSAKLYNSYDIDILGSYDHPYNNQIDSDGNTGATHTFTTGAIFNPGEVCTITLTPKYIDSSGTINLGKAITTNITVTPSAIPGGGTPTPPGTPGSSAILPPAIINEVVSNAAYVGSQLTGNVTFTIQNGANSNASYVFMDGVAGGNNLRSGLSPNYYTATTIPVSVDLTNSSSHTFYFYGLDSKTLIKSTTGGTYGTGYLQHTVNFTNPAPFTGGPAAPVISNPHYTPLDPLLGVGGTIGVDVPYDPTVGGYQVFIDNEAVPHDNPITANTSVVNGKVSIISSSGHGVGKTYSITVRAYSLTGIPGTLCSPLSYTVVDPQIKLSVDSNLNITWSVPVSIDYIHFYIGLVDTARIRSSISANKNVTTGVWTLDPTTTLTNDGTTLTFVDNRFSTTQQNYFTPGGSVQITATGNAHTIPNNNSSGVYTYTTSPISQAIPGGTPQIPAMSGVYATYDYSVTPTKTLFSWIDLTMPTGFTLIGYQYDFYVGSDTTGTHITISGSGTNVTGPDGGTYYTSTGTSLTTARTSPLYFRVRALLSYGVTTYATNWDGISV